MISKSSVSLRAARQDCGLSANGRLRGVQEFNERVGYSNPSLFSLRGTCVGFSQKSEYGTYTNNYNRGSNCRPNYAEANAFSLDPDFQSILYVSVGNQMTTCYGYYDTHDVMVGYSYCGRTTQSGTLEYSVEYTSEKPWEATTQNEWIGWTHGYFAGSANYYASFNRDDFNETRGMTVSASYPYFTMVCQGFSPSGVGEARTRIKRVRAYYT